MRTKTLLLAAAAALAAGILTSQAQVYSANVVGYVNISLTNGVLDQVAPALDLDGTGTNNTVASIFTTPVINDTVFVYNGTTYDGLTYKVVSLGGHPPVLNTNWYNSSGVLSSNYPINPGQSVFYLPAANETNTQVGTVLQGTNLVNKYFPAASKLNLLASQVPISGGLTSVLGYNPTINDTVYIYDNGGYDGYTYKVVSLGGHPPVLNTNWYTSAGSQIEPVINVGQGFWLQAATTTNWTQNFIVQ